MLENPVQSLLQTALSRINGIADINSTIGKPIETPDGTVVIPIGKVTYGYITGGSEFANAASLHAPFAGGIGGSATITPTAFLIIGKTGAQLLPLDAPNDIYSRMIDIAPQLLNGLKELLTPAESSKAE